MSQVARTGGRAGHPHGPVLLSALYRHDPGADRLADLEHLVIHKNGENMNPPDNTTVQALSILGPTLVFGFLLGWFLALSHLGDSSSVSDRNKKDE